MCRCAAAKCEELAGLRGIGNGPDPTELNFTLFVAQDVTFPEGQ